MDYKGKYYSQHVLPPHTHPRGILHFMREGKYYESECTETTHLLDTLDSFFFWYICLFLTSWEKKEQEKKILSLVSWWRKPRSASLPTEQMCAERRDSQHWVIFTAQLHTLLPDSRVGQYSGPTHHCSWLLPRHTKNLGVYNKLSGIQGRKKNIFVWDVLLPLCAPNWTTQ